ncbi:MAG TPA: GNAT family N-acetyltransferase [Cyclobacteriaceae bacterium]|nr:GNAT family N-acetyltransferase [Cyclobacteriaceae bacterium]
MPNISLKRYSPNDKQTWNNFVSEAKNATFLFNRDYVDYHSDRFIDHSLLVYSGDNLEALFVANEDGNTIHSHAGLTYGGMILLPDVRLEEVASIFYHVLKYYKEQSFSSIQYKTFPSYFTTYPAYEDEYVLFLLNAELTKREASCVISRSEPMSYRNNREKSVRDSKAIPYKINIATDPTKFWRDVLEPNLFERYSAKPVHTPQEMKLLMERFPTNIKLYEIYDDELLAGAVIYEMPNAVQAQYLSATPTGRKNGALDFLIDHLVTNVYQDKDYFSLGTSNEDEGRSLNRGLMSWKEGFGARTRVHDFYRIETRNFSLLSSYA